jgi:8-oxo-dGTP diphosphatase
MSRNVSVIFLHNDKGEVLLQQKTSDHPFAADKWCFFGGGIEDGETHKEAIIREAYEELRYKLSNATFLFTKDLNNNIVEKMHFFLDSYDETQELELHEGQALGWFSKEQISDLDMLSWDKEAIHRIFEEFIS